MTNTGGINPNAPDVRFPLSVALPAARDLFQMSKKLDAIQTQRAKGYDLTTGFWTGPHYDTFFQNSITIALHADGTRVQLQSLANQIAEIWAAARSDQDRLNWARWIMSQEADYTDRDVERLFGRPPANRPTPVGPDYNETAQTNVNYEQFREFGP